MAKARALDKRRKSIRNIRKITRTMELIATARFKKAMDRAMQPRPIPSGSPRLVADLAASGLEVSHPLLASRDETEQATLLVLTANRGLCGGYNGTCCAPPCPLSGAQGASAERDAGSVRQARHLGLQIPQHQPDETFTHFEDKPSFDEVEVLAKRYLELFIAGNSIGWTSPTCDSRASAGK